MESPIMVVRAMVATGAARAARRRMREDETRIVWCVGVCLFVCFWLFVCVKDRQGVSKKEECVKRCQATRWCQQVIQMDSWKEAKR